MIEVAAATEAEITTGTKAGTAPETGLETGLDTGPGTKEVVAELNNSVLTAGLEVTLEAHQETDTDLALIGAIDQGIAGRHNQCP